MSNSLSTMQVVRGVIHPMNKFMGSLTDDLYRNGNDGKETTTKKENKRKQKKPKTYAKSKA